jgi:pimeloyl-ACP methyl ester carboxylesterase
MFARDWRVAAMSWSGMGRSGHRDNYSIAGFAQEAFEAASAGQLLASADAPILIAHSFGGIPAAGYASRNPAAIRGLVLIDSFIRTRRRDPNGGRPMPVYESREQAVGRFRLAPPQRVASEPILRLIAEQSVKEVVNNDGSTGWTWRFDPSVWHKIGLDRFGDVLAGVTCPAAFVWGEISDVCDPEQKQEMQRAVPHAISVTIPAAAHHVMFDQPLALIAALRTVLAFWQQPDWKPAAEGGLA